MCLRVRDDGVLAVAHFDATPLGSSSFGLDDERVCPGSQAVGLPEVLPGPVALESKHFAFGIEEPEVGRACFVFGSEADADAPPSPEE